jgi:hypothetical protein
MGLDIRLPIGMLFTLIGILLAAFGFFSNPAIYGQSLGININLGWGLVLFLFGSIMLYLGARGMFSHSRPQEAALKEKKPRH